MELKYTGPRPVISEQGIDFKDGKEDKYVYIQNAMQILHAINHNYEKGRIYKDFIEDNLLTDSEIENIIMNHEPAIKQIIKEDIESYIKYLDEEIQNISKTHPLLNDLEITALKNNLEMMKDYRTQRAINKIYYMNIIKVISNVIKEHKIRDISAPFNEKFWHIMQTVQGELMKGRDYKKSKLSEHENSTIELAIDNY